MAQIKIKEGLDIPIKGQPTKWGNPVELSKPRYISLNLRHFSEVAFKLLVRLEDKVQLGQPLLEDQALPGRFLVSPACGIVHEIRRGVKRRLLDIVIEVASQEEIMEFPKISLQNISNTDLLDHLKRGGLFAHIRQRPFNSLANSAKQPRSIFIKAIESAPLTPPAELQVLGYEKEFQVGLDALAKLSNGNVHLVCRSHTDNQAFINAKNVHIHTAEGMHPIANHSLHIQKIDPIKSADDIVWTLTARDVVAIGYFLTHGKYFVSQVISIAGPAILENKIGYYRTRQGYPISDLMNGRIQQGHVRLLSGDPLTGLQVNDADFMAFNDVVFCAIEENQSREFLHFFRLGKNKYTSSGAYLSGHEHNDKTYDFTTNQHGEKRAFIDGSIYDQYMPLSVPTMLLVKAILAEDYDLAIQLGLLEVASEDFALPSFVCPSKIEMIDIVKNCLHRHINELLK